MAARVTMICAHTLFETGNSDASSHLPQLGSSVRLQFEHKQALCMCV
jgi:hypothetical protein